jgi:aspartate/tyrosine/aromatic aminotransferase
MRTGSATANITYFLSHHNIWRDARVPQRTFTYYHPESRGLDFAGLMDDIKVILSAHTSIL